jgi:hypothetical protein
MAKARMLTEAEALELLAFLITAARTQMDEPAQYGPLRLLTATERLSGFMLDRASPENQPILKQMIEDIPEMHMRMTDADWYRERLDTLCKDIATLLVQNSELSK